MATKQAGSSVTAVQFEPGLFSLVSWKAKYYGVGKE